MNLRVAVRPFVRLALALVFVFGSLDPAQGGLRNCVRPFLRTLQHERAAPVELIRARQRWALEVLASESSLPAELRQIAADKLRYLESTALNDPVLAEWAVLPKDRQTQVALDYALKSFVSVEFDTPFREALIRQLGRSALSDEDTIARLMPIARGAEFVQTGEIRVASEAIAEVAGRGAGFPRRSRASIPRADDRDILLHEPIKAVRPFSNGNANQTFIVEFENGRRAIFKPHSGELPPGFFDFQGHVNYSREVNAEEAVEKWLGNAQSKAEGKSRLVTPPAVEVILSAEGKSYGLGSLQRFQEDFITLDQLMKSDPGLWEVIRHSPEWGDTEARIRTIDFLLGNHDRLPNNYYTEGNFKNLLIKVDRKSPKNFQIALIDNSLGRPGVPWFRVENAPLGGHIPEDLARQIMNLDETAFRRAMHGRLPDAGTEDFLGRVRAVQDRIRESSPLRMLAKSGHSSIHPKRYSTPFDLPDEPRIPTGVLPVGPEATQSERLETLAGFRIADAVSPPGKTYLGTEPVVRKDSRVILNVVTENPAQISPITNVDVWDGVEPLVAQMRAGRTLVGQLDPASLEILINGRRVSGEEWRHWVDAGSADLKHVEAQTEQVSARPGTFSVSGRLSNHSLGSRTTLGAVEKISKERRPKIAVYFGTFDPIHEGHMRLVGRARELGFDEVVIIPDYAPRHKPDATPYEHRLAMARSRISGENGVNVLIRNPSDVLERFGMQVFLQQVKSLFASDDVYTLIGRDAFDGIVKQGLVQPAMQDRFLVFERKGVNPQPIPSRIKSRVQIIKDVDELEMSSTKLRNQVRAGAPFSEKEVHPSVSHYIQEHKLYR